MAKSIVLLGVGITLIYLITMLLKKVKPKRNPQHSQLSNSTQTVIGNLSSDILIEIFIRIPVSSLLLCKTVSRSWYDTISSHMFVQCHLQFTSRNQETICKFGPDDHGTLKIVFLRAQGPPICVLDGITTMQRLTNVEIDFFTFSRNMSIAGSLNGIVCLRNLGEFATRYLGLWNPSIGKWKLVQLPTDKTWKNMSVGLGYDVGTSDLKIIVLVPVDGLSSGVSRVEFYSVGENSWNNNDNNIISFVPMSSQCKFIKGSAPYWIGGYERLKGCAVAKVDPATRVYREFRFAYSDENVHVQIIKHRDQVAAVVLSSVDYYAFQLCTLDEVDATWNVIKTVQHLPNQIMSVPQSLGSGHIVLMTLNEDLEDFAFLWRPDTDDLLHNSALGNPEICWFESYCHTESLVSIEGMVPI